MKPICMLSPCGTSLLTNGIPDNVRSVLWQNANATSELELPQESRQLVSEYIRARRANASNWTIEEAAKGSAELNGIIRFYEGDLQRGKRDRHYILSTDTYFGKTTADIVSAWLEAHGLETEFVPQHATSGLRTNNLLNFSGAISSLVKWLTETLPPMREAGYHVVFNLTGGFKSIQGVLQSLAQFYADESVYIFETSTELLRIPRLPAQMDPDGFVRVNTSVFRRLKLGENVTETEFRQLPETLTLSIDGKYDLSAWGEAVWDGCKKSVYEQSLLESPGSRIRYSDAFRRACDALSADRLYEVNKRMDSLATYLRTDENPRSLDFKPLRGNPRPPSTHEFDAWADRDAKRVFCHFDGERLILDALDKGLH